jgi:hypothetical protein
MNFRRFEFIWINSNKSLEKRWKVTVPVGQNPSAQHTEASHHGPSARVWDRGALPDGARLRWPGWFWWVAGNKGSKRGTIAHRWGVVGIWGAGKGRGSPSVALHGGGSWFRGCDGGGADTESRSYRRVDDQRGIGCVLREAGPGQFGAVHNQLMRRPLWWIAWLQTPFAVQRLGLGWRLDGARPDGSLAVMHGARSAEHMGDAERGEMRSGEE